MIVFIQSIIIFGLCMYILTLKYRQRVHGGEIVITHQDDKTLISLELDKPPSEIEKMSYILFKVTDHPSEQ